MRILLILEEVAFFLASLAVFHITGTSWWIFLACFLLPDLGMLGYLVGPRTGAVSYNLTHHKAIPVLIAASWYYHFDYQALVVASILFAHFSFDRILGYGLKYGDNFRHTHLGMIGRVR